MLGFIELEKVKGESLNVVGKFSSDVSIRFGVCCCRVVVVFTVFDFGLR